MSKISLEYMKKNFTWGMVHQRYEKLLFEQSLK